MIFNLSRSKKHQLLVIIGTIAALIGAGDSLYLTISHYSDSTVVCSLIDGCNIVLSSSWASFFNVPLAVFGLAYYVLVLGLLFWYQHKSKSVWSLLLAVSTVGLVISFGLLYLQLGIIGSVCEYCLLSLVSTMCVWGSTLSMMKMQNGKMESSLI